jgi:integrase
MPVIKLTIQSIQNASALDGRETVYRDTEIKGFSLKATPSGSKIYFYQYRLGGRAGVTRKIRMGAFPVVKPEEARGIAKQYAAELARKQDPQERLKKETDQKLESQRNSFTKLLEVYAAEQLSQNRSGSEVKRVFEKEFYPTLKNVPVKTISRNDVSKVISRIQLQNKMYAANRALSFIKTFFRWAVSEGYISGDPTSGMKKPFKNEVARDRTLNPQEIKFLWACFDQLGSPFGNALKLLLLTGQRRDEVSTMRWKDIDFESESWSLPRSNTKNKLPHIVPLVAQALEILKQQKKLGEFVFTTDGKTCISGWSKTKVRIEKWLMENKTNITNWRIHDLRRTVASNLGDLSYSDKDIGLILNHQNRGVTAIYNRSNYFAKKADMLKAWSGKLDHMLKS